MTRCISLKQEFCVALLQVNINFARARVHTLGFSPSFRRDLERPVACRSWRNQRLGNLPTVAQIQQSLILVLHYVCERVSAGGSRKLRFYFPYRTSFMPRTRQDGQFPSNGNGLWSGDNHGFVLRIDALAHSLYRNAPNPKKPEELSPIREMTHMWWEQGRRVCASLGCPHQVSGKSNHLLIFISWSC